MARPLPHRRFSAGLWAVLFAALFLRAIFPQGIMAERESDGAIAVALCNSDGVWLIPTGDGPDETGAPNHDRNSVCAFAALSLPAIAGPAGFDLPLPAAIGFAPARYRQGVPAPVRTRFVPPARGPPQTV